LNGAGGIGRERWVVMIKYTLEEESAGRGGEGEISRNGMVKFSCCRGWGKREF
jgi:hypothetical protein